MTYSGPATKDELLEEIKVASAQGKKISFEFQHLRFAFGFTRPDGLACAFGLLFGKTEEQVGTAPDFEILRRIKEWCIDNIISMEHDWQRDIIIFER